MINKLAIEFNAQRVKINIGRLIAETDNAIKRHNAWIEKRKKWDNKKYSPYCSKPNIKIRPEYEISIIPEYKKENHDRRILLEMEVNF